MIRLPCVHKRAQPSYNICKYSKLMEWSTWTLKYMSMPYEERLFTEKTYKRSICFHRSNPLVCFIIFFFFNCMFYQVLGVPHSSSSTPTWGSVLPSIVETRDQNSRGCPLLFSNRNLGSFCAQGTEILYTHSLWEVVDHSRSKMHETCLIIIHDPSMRPGPESNRGPLD